MKKPITKNKYRRIYQLAFILFTAYLIVGSLFKFANTRDHSYLIAPALLIILIVWELYYEFLRTGDKK